MERVTHGDGDSQILYFTTSSLDAADEGLWFIREQDGCPNIHHLDLASGEGRQISQNNGGRMWQYQGFGGTPHRGLAVWSVALHAASGTIYYIQDGQICAATRDGEIRVLADLPEDETTAFIDVSDCGRWLCVPTTDARALVEPTADGQPYGGNGAMDRRCQDEGLNSYLRVYDTDSGRFERLIAVPRCWITHVQFRPGDPMQILYNHEWPAQKGVRRMWHWDGIGHRCLRPATESHSAEDWVNHEVWTPDGEAVVYHGGFAKGNALIGRWAPQGLTELPLPEGWNRYGHFQIGKQRDDLLVCDGYYEEPKDAPGSGRWIALAQVDWLGGRVTWTPLCQHRSAWRGQDDHPHPIFDHAGRYIYFTGGTEDGHRAVYRTEIPKGI